MKREEEIKKELNNRIMSYKVKEDIDELVSIYEARINSLQQQIDVLLEELKCQKK